MAETPSDVLFIHCRFRKGSLVMKLPRDSQVASFPTFLYATVEGSIGLLASLPKPWYDWLARLQEAARRVIKGVGGWDHSTYRAFFSDKRIPSLILPPGQSLGSSSEMDMLSKGFIDGDLVECVLDLPKDKQEQVAALMLVSGPPPTPHPDTCQLDYIINKLEELVQGLH
jgi:DNA damage-binding protein 1